MDLKVSEADEFLLPSLRQLRSTYRKTSIHGATYDEGLKMLEVARSLSGSSSSYQIAALESFLSDILLTAGNNSATVLKAKIHSESALAILAAVRCLNADVLRLSVHTSLLSTISSKAMGDIDEAFRAIEAAKNYYLKTFSATSVDIVPLVRQEALMHQREELFAHIAEHATIYKSERPTEYYATVKRFFEYLLNRGQIASARSVKLAFERAYLTAIDRLPLVAKVSFLKNMGQYYLLDGQRQLGESVLIEALKAAAQFELHGQRIQITKLLREVRGSSIALSVFYVR